MTVPYDNQGPRSPIGCSKESSDTLVVDQTAEKTLERQGNEDAGT